MEIFSYTGLTATSFTGVIRGLDGTTQPAHSIGAKVRHVGSATDIQRGASAVNRIQDEGTALAQRAILNFTGAGVTATDDAANGRANVASPAATFIKPLAKRERLPVMRRCGLTQKFLGEPSCKQHG